MNLEDTSYKTIVIYQVRIQERSNGITGLHTLQIYTER